MSDRTKIPTTFQPGDVVNIKGVRVLAVFHPDTIVIDVEHEDGEQLALDTSLPGNFTVEHAAPTDMPKLTAEVERLRDAEDRVHRAFADADVEGVDLNAMTVAELTAFVMAAINGAVTR